jgi:hypothetical protein
MSNLIQIVGLFGVAMINVTYLLITSGKMRPDRYLYPLINFVGASLIMVALVPEWNLPAFLMEASWAAISLLSVATIFYRRNIKR